MNRGEGEGSTEGGFEEGVGGSGWEADRNIIQMISCAFAFSLFLQTKSYHLSLSETGRAEAVRECYPPPSSPLARKRQKVPESSGRITRTLAMLDSGALLFMNQIFDLEGLLSSVFPNATQTIER